MAPKRIEMCLVLGLVLMLWHQAQAQSSCSNAIMGLSPCLSYVTGNASTPSPSCCSQLGNFVQTAPQCLCPLLNGAGGSLGIALNQTQALTLPGACQVQTPPLNQCNAVANPPASSPSVSPAASPATSPSSPADATNPATTPNPTTTHNPNIPSGTGSKTVPSPNGKTSDGNQAKPFHVAALVLFFAALASNVINF